MNLTGLFGKTAGPGDESQYRPHPVGQPDNASYTPEQGVHRGMTVVLPAHIHKFVHDPDQPAPAKAHLLLSEVKKQIAKNAGPEGEEGSTGGLGNYWTPSPHKAVDYTSDSFQVYKRHRLEHNCDDPETGEGGCPSTQVVLHADTPPEKHHWNEQYREGEKYDPQISWRLPVRPGAPLGIRGVSWREGNDHWDFSRKHSEEGYAHHKNTPFNRYDFSSSVKKNAGVTMGAPGPMGESSYDEDEGEHQQLWDQWHPKLQGEVHRHLAVDLPSGHPAHNDRLPLDERARAVLQHVITRGNVGHHWTDDPSYKFMSGDRIEPGQTHVTLHAKTPPRSHIEDNSWTLRDDRAVFDWDAHPEREVPMKHNAPMELNGVSWHTAKGPVRHDFANSIRVHAVDEEERKRPQNRWMGGVPEGLQGGTDDGGDAGGDSGASSSTTAAYAPPGTMGEDNEGHRVQMTTMDGWAHDDGSHGHDDNTTVGDHTVYTQNHTWLPQGRYWGPNSAQNDQRIFEGDKLRPEVREDILSRINHVFRPRYKEWPRWTMVYFAGSEAAKWQPFNGDFDILIGIDWGKFRTDNPGYQDKTDAEIATEMTDDLWKNANVDGYWFTLADGRKVGPFDRTFFVNPEAYDIRRLHPYAAYNVTSNDWAVHPLEVPGDWDATHLPEAYWGYAESLLNEVKAIGMLPPEERHRMAANLYEELHTHRSDAFGEEGKGLFDLSNVVEKYLDQHPDRPWAKLKQWKSESPSGPQPWVPTTARRTTLTALFTDAAAKPKGADMAGLMIAIVPPKSVGRKLLVEDGEPLEALHVTLAYLGSSGEHTKAQVRDLPSLVEAWARTQKPFEAKVGGAGTFTNPGQHVLWAAVDIPGGGGIRHDLSELLEEHGYKVRNDHGWTPHITLKYHTSHVRFLPKIEPVTWAVKEIMLCIGDDWSPIRLGS
jgi:2'-5' RNA ligase